MLSRSLCIKEDDGSVTNLAERCYGNLLEDLQEAKINGIIFMDGETPMLQIRYMHKGEQKAIFTRSHMLLAAHEYCLRGFYEDAKTPSESLLG